MNTYHSKSVTSTQTGPHEKLVATVRLHMNSDYKKPYRQHNLDAYKILTQAIAKQKYTGLILDSCCGTGMSTRILANRFPQSLVVGLDQSIKRLEKITEGMEKPNNCLMLQANCEDLWRLCANAGIRFDAHYILYPNPWPKINHLKRRWHGHSVFPVLKNIAPTTVLRSNWKLYLQEFSFAWEILTGKKSCVESLNIDYAMTLFEKKYSNSGQNIFELVVSC